MLPSNTVIGPWFRCTPEVFLNRRPEQRVLRLHGLVVDADSRVPSTSLPTMGSMALFWRASETGWSIAYWKKSPSAAAVAAFPTLPVVKATAELATSPGGEPSPSLRWGLRTSRGLLHLPLP